MYVEMSSWSSRIRRKCRPGAAAQAELMAPRWRQGTIAPRALKKNNKENVGKWPKANLSFEGVLRA